jgi:hypothetical protein
MSEELLGFLAAVGIGIVVLVNYFRSSRHEKEKEQAYKEGYQRGAQDSEREHRS